MMLATPGLTWAQQVEVNVEGDYPQLQDNAEAFLGEVEGRSAGSLRRYASTAEAQVEEALRALGYYSPMIQWEVVEQPGDDETPARLVLTVQPGEPIRVRSRQVSIEGPASRDPDFVGTLPEKPSEGDVLNHGTEPPGWGILMVSSPPAGWKSTRNSTLRIFPWSFVVACDIAWAK